jgi:GMP synthase-like glutamine amidotransferase
MRVLVFRHVPFESGGRLHDVLEPRGVSLEYVDLFRDGAQIPDLAAAAGLIFMGGPMSANDDLPYLRREMDIIRYAAGEGRPVLGICLGAQLIARAAGARVFPNARKEIGWFDVHLTEAGRADALFASLEPSETVFHWHGETFDLPRGAAWLAYSDNCRHQAFRLGRAVYGLQYHLEVTPAMIEQWCLEDVNCGDVRELDAPLDARCNEERLARLSDVVFGRWCDFLQVM